MIIIINKEGVFIMNNEIKKRNTKQKSLLLDYFIKNKHKHLSIDTILQDLSSDKQSISQATVYRLINTLVQEGLIRKIVIDDKKCSCYQYIDTNQKCYEHYHLICNKCGAMLHFDNNIIDNLKDNIYSTFNFEIDTSKVVFYGICSKCKK